VDSRVKFDTRSPEGPGPVSLESWQPERRNEIKLRINTVVILSIL
jgi:hypothetical protein